MGRIIVMTIDHAPRIKGIVGKGEKVILFLMSLKMRKCNYTIKEES